MEKVKIRPYRAGKDEALVYSMWRRTVGHLWPLSLDTFRHVTIAHAHYMEGDHMIAASGASPVGFVATLPDVSAEDRSAAISLLLVDPIYQRRGIGSKLLETAYGYLTGLGAERIRLGGGLGNGFWPGLPVDLEYTRGFFERFGWQFGGTICELVCDLGGWKSKEAGGRITVRAANESDGGSLAEIANSSPPVAAARLRQHIARGEFASLLAAADGQKQIIGAAGLFQIKAGAHHPRATWRALLGEELGGFEFLAVPAGSAGQAACTALAAEGTRLLREQGMKRALAGEPEGTEIFRQLGYQVWREYIPGWREVPRYEDVAAFKP